MNEEYSFMNEKIKDKPFYKKKWVKILAGILTSAIVFGTVAAVTFVKVSSWMEFQINQKELQNIEIPQDTHEEVLPPEEPQTDAEEPIVVETELSIEDYESLCHEFQEIAEEASRSLVLVTAVSNDVDWFDEAYENSGETVGMIIGDNGIELLILTGYSTVENRDDIAVTFADGTSVAAVLKNYDRITGLAVISVNLSDISSSTQEAIAKAELGNSIRLKAGDPVIAIGKADGKEGSMNVGMLTSIQSSQSVVDAEYTILVTNMMRNTGADGVLLNLKGQVIGLIQERYASENMKIMLTAYAISDMKGLIEHLSNNQDVSYLGIKGVSVTEDAKKEGIPSGVYVTEVMMDSPAMKGGIQSGDIIQAINGQKVTTMPELSAVLTRLSYKQNISLEGQRLTKNGYKKINYQTSLSVLE